MQEIIARQLEQIAYPTDHSGPTHSTGVSISRCNGSNSSFEDIHDILAVGVMTDTVRNCYAALGMLRDESG